MDRIHSLDVSNFMQLFRNGSPEAVIVNCNESLALLANQLQKSIVVRASQYGDLIKLGTVQFLIVVQETKHLVAIELEDVQSHSAKIIGAENNNWILHDRLR